jgi:hypothetical protein
MKRQIVKIGYVTEIKGGMAKISFDDQFEYVMDREFKLGQLVKLFKIKTASGSFRPGWNGVKV